MPDDVKLYRYSVRERPLKEGDWTSWAIVVLGSDGFFSTISDYGNYSYGWWNFGSGDFRSFVLGLCRKKGEGSYFKSKMGRKDELDVDKTVQHIKELIVEYRRSGHMTFDQARAEWKLMRELEEGGTLDDWMRETSFDDAWEIGTYKYNDSLNYFAERILPVLGDAIEAELAAEAAMAEMDAAVALIARPESGRIAGGES